MVRTFDKLMRFLSLIALSSVTLFQLGAATVYLGTTNGQIGTFDTLSGVFQEIRHSGTSLDGLAFDSIGNLDAIDTGIAPNIGYYRVNTATGGLTFVANTTNAVGQAGLASGPSRVQYLADLTNLYTINPTTGAATLTGPLNITTGFNYFNIGAGIDGNLYGDYGGKLYRLNTANGAATFIGNTGIVAYDLFGADNALYAVSTSSALYSLDTTTGAATFLRNISGLNGVVQASAVVQSTPEPSTALLCAAALLCVGVSRLRRRA